MKGVKEDWRECFLFLCRIWSSTSFLLDIVVMEDMGTCLSDRTST